MSDTTLRLTCKTAQGVSIPLSLPLVEPCTGAILVDVILNVLKITDNRDHNRALRVLYQGRPLSPTALITDQGLKDGDTVVAIFMRPQRPQRTPLPFVEPPPLSSTNNNVDVGADAGNSQQGENSWLPAFNPLNLFGQRRPAAPAAPSPPPRAPSPIAIDPTLISQLTEMGFSENRAIRALASNRLNVQRAMNWLLDHADDPDPSLDEPVSQDALRRMLRPQLRRSAGRAPPPPGPVTPDTTVIHTLPTNIQMARQLQDMGFSEEQATEALRLTRNNFEAAAHYLLGDLEVD